MQAFDGSRAHTPVGSKLLLVAPRGLLRQRLSRGLKRQGYQVTRVRPGAEDLFSRALGKQAIVFAGAGNLLDVQLSQAHDAGEALSAGAHLAEVLRASNAPGVQLLVFLFPLDGYQSEVAQIRRYGKPYVILRSPALLEEVAEAALSDAPSQLWLPKAGAISATPSSVVLQAISNALITEEQGRETPIVSSRYHLAGLLAAAAATRRQRPVVHAVHPGLYRWARAIARWLSGSEPAALRFADRVLGNPAAFQPRRSVKDSKPPARGLGARVRALV